MMEKEENISRDMIIATILTSISAETIKKYVDRYEDNDSAIEKMISSINEMLHQCRMAELDEEISPYDFLLLLAIYKTDYQSLFDEDDSDSYGFDQEENDSYVQEKSEEEIDEYPYRTFIFGEFLN